MPAPYDTIVEGVLVCPDCGHSVHSYYLPQDVRYEQSRLQKAVDEWQTRSTTESYKKYQNRLAYFQKLFDAAQLRCKALFAVDEKEQASEANTK